ncbi:MAG: hypothetical protein QGG40_20770, partial [Myxococcota bacterium]|nr:hypothetical protein [Myxococcota bacterium]
PSSLVLLTGETTDGRVAMQLYEPRTESFSKLITGEAGDDRVESLMDLALVLPTYLQDNGTLRPDRVSFRVASLDINSNSVLSSILLDPEPLVEVQTIRGGPPWYVWTGVATLAAGAAGGAAIWWNQRTVDPNQGTVIIPIP